MALNFDILNVTECSIRVRPCTLTAVIECLGYDYFEDAKI